MSERDARARLFDRLYQRLPEFREIILPMDDDGAKVVALEAMWAHDEPMVRRFVARVSESARCPFCTRPW